jgi:ribonuclease-3
VTRERLRRRVAESPLMRQAFTHPSYANERKVPDNQRLEYLGDAVLQLTVSDLVFRRFPNLAEGALSRLRAALVREESLARRAERLGMGELLRVGSGEDQAALRTLPSVLCDTYEAMIGVLYLEDGFEATRAFVAAEVEEELAELGDRPWLADPKTALQEALQRLGRLPVYRVVAATGPAHRPLFTVVVEDAGRELGRGSGPSKKAAEEEAARHALEQHPELAPPVAAQPSG